MYLYKIMEKSVISISKEDSILKASKLMTKHKIGCVVICHNKKPLGMVTERDVIRRVVSKGRDPKTTQCSSIMSKPAVKLDAHKDITDAISVMNKRKVKRVILTENKEIVGIVTMTDILKSGADFEEEILQKLGQIFPIVEKSIGYNPLVS